MNFARWTSIPPNLGLEDAEQFIVDIPEGTSREDVIATLALVCGVAIEETDGLDFQEKWPRAIRQQFAALDAHSDVRWSWLNLK